MTMSTASKAFASAVAFLAALPLGCPAAAQNTVGDAQAERQNVPAQTGDRFYCEERRLGTWFYCETPKATETPQAAAAASVPAAAQLKAITEELDELKARAIMEPTVENVSAYIAFQRQQLDRAGTFADVWRRAIWQNPELDYTLERPISALGKRTWAEQRRLSQAEVLATLNQRYGVFYFYSSACAACEVFSPIMRGVADRFGMTVMAVSVDGGPNPSFPRHLVDTGQFEAMGLAGQQVPAVVLFDTHTKRPMPIGFGVMAADEVMDRIVALTTTQAGEDF